MDLAWTAAQCAITLLWLHGSLAAGLASWPAAMLMLAVNGVTTATITLLSIRWPDRYACLRTWLLLGARVARASCHNLVVPRVGGSRLLAAG